MAIYPNNYYHLSNGSRRTLGDIARNKTSSVGGAERCIFINANISKQTSVPDGYDVHGIIQPYTAGGMSSFSQSRSSLTGTSALINGKTLESLTGTIIASLSGDDNSLSLITSMTGTGAVVTLDAENKVLSLIIGMAGNGDITFISDNIVLGIINPMTGSFSSIFSGIADLRGILSMSGEFTSSQTETIVNYGGKIYVTLWGTDGYSYPSGTATQPVNTLACARALAIKYNLREYYVNGTHTLLDNYSDCTFYGVGALSACQVILNSTYTLENVKFVDLEIHGEQNSIFPLSPPDLASLGTTQFETCYIDGVQNLSGNFRKCQFSGSISIYPGKTVSATESVIEGDYTFFDLQSTPDTIISMDIVSGWFQAINAVTGTLIELNVKGGEVSLDASCTGGEYYLEGIGTLFNDSAMTKKENHFTWDEPTSYHLEAGSTGKALDDSGGAGATPPTVEEIRAEIDANSTKLININKNTNLIPAAL